MSTEPTTAMTTIEGNVCSSEVAGAPKRKSAKQRAKKSASPRTAKKTSSAKKAVLYSNQTPRGLMAVGTFVKFLGGARLKNTWLKKGAVGRVFGYRPGRTKGGLYAVRFEKGATLLSVKRVTKVARGTRS